LEAGAPAHKKAGIRAVSCNNAAMLSQSQIQARPIRRCGEIPLGVLLALAVVLGLLGGGGLCSAAAEAGQLEQVFRQPPPSARPWVYWFWMDGNASREGITADLEAMQRAGIGGVIIMEVDVGIPRGPVKFMGPQWRELFKHVAAEAGRLGLEIDLNASPGWTGSGGPWIKPEQSMQQLVCSETNLAGGGRFEGVLPQPPSQEGFYRDVAVLAFPTPAGNYRIADIQEKALYTRGHYSSEAGVRSSFAPFGNFPYAQPEQMIKKTFNLTSKLEADGRLRWDVPPGSWTLLRFGRTSTGANTRPAPLPGLGLECDKLDKAALEAHFEQFLGTLMADIGPWTGKSLVSTHIDSWEMGPQNWSARFPDEFRRLRGYDPLPYLSALTGRVVESVEVSERFLWDLRQTVSELIIENYARHLGTLAHRHGLRLSIQPYDGTPCDDLAYGASADVPMCEFWGNCFNTFFTCAEAASIAHVYGRRVVAAEAFTSDDKERWLFHPGSMKALGDWAFCAGVNRFVFHRYAHQPWLDRWPGMTMGPYGVHYERTQTWWELVGGWHACLSRCQALLQQGLAVADICYLAPEGAPHVFRPPPSALEGSPPSRRGYNFDACTPEALLTRMSVRDGRLVLPDGMSYRVLVLPAAGAMTPALLRRIEELVQAGATVVGSPPVRSPSLSNYPKCDAEVKRLAGELWGSTAEQAHGQGRVIRGGPSQVLNEPARAAEQALAQAKWIWRREGRPAAAAPVGKRFFRRAFVCQPGRSLESAHIAMTADNSFELWVNGRPVGSGDTFRQAFDFEVASLLKPGTNLLAVAAVNGGEGPNPAGLIGALVVKYRGGEEFALPTDGQWESAASAKEGWTDAATGGPWAAAMELGGLGMAPWGAMTKPFTQPELYPEYDFVAAVMDKSGVLPDFESDAPLRYTHRRDGEAEIYFVANPEDKWVGVKAAFRVSGKQPELWDPKTGQIHRQAIFQEKQGRTFLPLWLEPAGSVFVVFRGAPDSDPVVAIRREGKDLLPGPGQVLREAPVVESLERNGFDFFLSASEPGRYEIQTASGQTRRAEVGPLPTPAALSGPWQVQFQPGRGAPESVAFAELIDWSRHAEPGVKYFSGRATYRKTFNLDRELAGNGKRLVLDLGKVEVMAQVTLNGKDLGILWKAPYRVEMTQAVASGANTLEITVANLWPNRLIGDQALPKDQRVAWTTWNPFAAQTPLLESGLIGPVRVVAAQSVMAAK
jgi:hypothetical protein